MNTTVPDNKLVTRSEIKSIISHISRIPLEELEDDVRISEDLGVDSIMAMEIMATLEIKLGLTLDTEQFSDIDEVGDFISLIEDLNS